MKVVLIGCGHIAQQHATTLKSLKGVELAAVCDVRLEVAQRFADRYSISAAFADVESMLISIEPVVVHVLTPPDTHQPIIELALARNCHVVVEKPLAGSHTDALAIAKAQAASATTVVICHNYLFVPAMCKALELIDRGALGELISAEVYWRATPAVSNNRNNAQSWINSLPGGIYHEIGPHPIYLLNAILGELRLISAEYASPQKLELELRAMFKGQDKLGTLTLTNSELPVQKYIRIFGTRMSLHVDLGTNTLIRMRSRGMGNPARIALNLEYAVQLTAQSMANVFLSLIGRVPHGHQRFLEHYYSEFAKGLTPDSNVEDGVQNAQLLETIFFIANGNAEQ